MNARLDALDRTRCVTKPAPTHLGCAPPLVSLTLEIRLVLSTQHSIHLVHVASRSVVGQVRGELARSASRRVSEPWRVTITTPPTATTSPNVPAARKAHRIRRSP